MAEGVARAWTAWQVLRMRQRQGVQRLRGALDEIRPLAQSNLLTLPRGAGTLGSTSDSLTETSLAKRMLFFTSVGAARCTTRTFGRWTRSARCRLPLSLHIHPLER